MKVKNILFISLFLLIILTIGAASASDDTNSSDVVSINENQDLINDNVDDSVCKDNNVKIYVDEEDDDDVYEYEFVVGGDDNINIEFSSSMSGELAVKVNRSQVKLDYVDDGEGEEYIFIDQSNGNSSLDLSPWEEDYQISLDRLPVGVYGVDVAFTPTGATAPITKYFKITLVNESSGADEEDVIEFQNFYIYHHEDSIITIPQSFGPNLQVIINNKTQPIQFKDNKYCVDLTQFDLGKYDILISNSTGVLIDDEFTVGGVICADLSFTYRDSASIYLELPINATGNLVIMKEDVEIFDEPLVNGIARCSLSDISVGCYSFTAIYTGDDYDVQTFDDDISIYPIITCPSKITVGENKYMTFDFGSDAVGEITIEEEVVEYARVTLKDGKASVSLKDLEDGDIELYVGFDINGLQGLDTPFEIEVGEVPIKIEGSKDIKMNYNDGTVHKVTIYGTNGKYAEEDEYVEVEIGKKTFETAVGKNGVVSFKIPQSIAPGKYKIKTIYDEKTVTSTLVVKHVLKLNKVKIKKSAKKVVIKATLKQGKKPLKGKKVIFKFKGKKYTVKTNKKGVAKVKVKKSILKKLKVGKKFKYQASYLKDKVKKSVKIKK